jgi:hypothetical protein
MPGFIFSISLLALTVLSYGYIDPHLSKVLPYVAYYHRPLAATVFFLILLILFRLYLYFLKHPPKIWVIVVSACILIFSYPAFTYDIFNYMTTAKVVYTYRENPYLVMPVEIPNEPNLAFTRAANKVALYGPVWLFITAIPHYFGGGNVWATLFIYKLMNAAAYLGFCYFIFRQTKTYANVLFFALNPLVLIEVLMNAHNDIYMMLLALGGVVLWQNGKKISGLTALVLSWLIKGATLPLVIALNKSLIWTYWILTLVFFIIAPIREELYPWYAVWLVTTAALLPIPKHRFIYWFTIVLTFALELRNIPYLWMAYYEGPGPLLRLVLTVVPVGIFFGLYLWKKTKQQLFY